MLDIEGKIFGHTLVFEKKISLSLSYNFVLNKKSFQSACTDGSCTCTVYDDCYKTKHDVWINNCWFVDLPENNAIRLDYEVSNGAGQMTSGQYRVRMDTLLDWSSSGDPREHY